MDIPSVVLAETNAAERGHLAVALGSGRYAVKIASDANGVRQHLHGAHPIDAVILGNVVQASLLPDLLLDLRRRDVGVPLIVIFESATPQDIVDAVKCGATNVLVKPVRGEELCTALRDAIEALHRHDPRRPQQAYGLIGRSQSMRRLASVAGRIASCDAPVLIQGETGVGKEVLARRLHMLSPRAGKPFLKVNCAAIPSELIESELFGYNRGAFSGAVQDKPGVFELADRGVILLDEIGDMDLKLQAKLLQVLQDQQFHRVGGTSAVRVNVRIMAATHADLETAVANAAFRADLYYRLNVFNLHVPPLRERREDILPLVEYLLERHREPGVHTPPITRALEEALLSYNWPGNIRELENAVRKLVVLRTPALLIAELEGRSRQARWQFAEAGPPQIDCTQHGLEKISKAGDDAEVKAITTALEAARWNRKVAAYHLGLGYKALLYRMKKLSIADVDAPIIPKPRGAAERANTART